MRIARLYAAFKRFLMNNTKGRWLLLLLAPFVVTPADFVELDKSKGMFTRLTGWGLPVSSALFCGFAGSMVYGSLFKTMAPNISGLSGAEYATRLAQLQYSAYGVLFCLAFLGVYIYAFSAPIRFVALGMLFPKVKKDLRQPPIKYFLLVGSSGVVWATLFGALGGLIIAFGRATTNQAIGEQFFNEYGGWIFALLVVWGLMRLRRGQIRSEVHNQMFVTQQAKRLNMLWDASILVSLLLIMVGILFVYGRL
ncbi:hypothetical protein MACH10_33990 [Thalassospira tepidiphila]|uniref:hypothetical protein n=1 Tax=Thalassospira tepidiphila TaxID=393657 RepID=UPI00291F599A|nr:hypothetical protein MACH10_33990 [Thalassospira tepidiphila]